MVLVWHRWAILARVIALLTCFSIQMAVDTAFGASYFDHRPGRGSRQP